MTGPQQNIPNKSPNLSFGVTGCRFFGCGFIFGTLKPPTWILKESNGKTGGSLLLCAGNSPENPPKGRDFKYLEDPGIDV